MDVEPLDLGASGLAVGGALAILAAAVVVTVLVLVMWTVTLTVVAPTMGGAAAQARRNRERAWLQEVRESWMADPGEQEPPPPARPHPPVRGVGMVSTQDAGASTHLVAAQVAPTAMADSAISGWGFASMAIVRATVQPDHLYELPPHPHCNLSVYVLAGRGTVGSRRQEIRAGQIALHGRHSPIKLSALPDHRQPLEILVVAQAPSEGVFVADQPVVMEMTPKVRHHLWFLKALTDDLPEPQPQEVQVPAQVAAPVRSRPQLPTAIPAA